MRAHSSIGLIKKLFKVKTLLLLLSGLTYAQTLSSYPSGLFSYSFIHSDTTMGSQGYFWGLDGLVSNVTAKGKVLKKWFSIVSLGKAISRETIKESKFGQSYFMLKDVTTRKYHIFPVAANGYVYPKHIDFGRGTISSVELVTWIKDPLYTVPELVGDRISQIGGKYFITKKGFVGTFGSEGELYIHTRNDQGDYLKFKKVKVLGGNYFISNGSIYTISNDGKVIEKAFVDKISNKDILIAGGNYLLTKSGRLFTMANYRIEGTDKFRVKVDQKVPPILPQVLTQPYFYGGTFLSYREGVGPAKKNFVLAITHTGKPVITGWKCKNCKFDYNGDKSISEDEVRDWDYGKVPPKERYGQKLIGHNYVIFAEGTVWTINDKGRISLAIRLNAQSILENRTGLERNDPIHEPVATNFPYR